MLKMIIVAAATLAVSQAHAHGSFHHGTAHHDHGISRYLEGYYDAPLVLPSLPPPAPLEFYRPTLWDGLHWGHDNTTEGPTVDWQPDAKVIHVPPGMTWDDTPLAPSPSVSFGHDRPWPTQEQYRLRAIADETACYPVHVYGDTGIWHRASGCL